MRTRLHLLVSATAVAVILAACGGGGTVTPTTSISGAAVKGPVNGATVTVRDASSGAVLGTTTTGIGGLYSIDVQFSGDVIIEVNGGTYEDEATGNPTTLSTPMRSVLTLGGGRVTGVVTPLTTLAYTYAFGNNSTTATANGFNSMATTVANQFQLNGVNLATTVPVVSGTLNPYGRVLSGVSQYLQLNNVTLQTLLTNTYTTAEWTQFSTQFNTAYLAANPGSAVTFNFDGNAFVITGTGSGGGSGSCGVAVNGTISANGMSVPINNLNYCVSGIAAGSCDSGNSSLSQALSGQQGVSGAANLSYTFSPSCAADAFSIVLQ